MATTMARRAPLRRRIPLRRRQRLERASRPATHEFAAKQRRASGGRRRQWHPDTRIIAERPAPLNAGLRGATYCDGPDAWQPGCGTCATCGGAIVANERTGRAAAWFCANKLCRRWWLQNHQWPVARSAALRRDGRRCSRKRCGSDLRIQVDHRTPLAETVFERGLVHETKYRTGCHNHLDNLQTLCVTHHAAKTAADERRRSNRRRAEGDAA